MFSIKIGKKDYKVKFGMNSFADTDLMERTQRILTLMNESGTEDDDDVRAVGMLKDLFQCTRDLYYYGFERFNPVESPQEVGNLLDDYIEEEAEEKRGILQLFMLIAEELFNQGFLADLMADVNDSQQVEKAKVVKLPQDHKRK